MKYLECTVIFYLNFKPVKSYLHFEAVPKARGIVCVAGSTHHAGPSTTIEMNYR